MGQKLRIQQMRETPRIKRKRKKLRIGMDFHGLLVDVQFVKQTEAVILTGKWILPELLKREIAVREGLLTEKQYDEMNRRIYEKRGSILTAPAVPGSLDAIHTLVKSGHEVDIITASGEAAFQNAVLWCRTHGLEIPGVRLFGVGRDGDKIHVVYDLDAYLDDEIKHLDALKGIIDHLFLLDRAYNEHEHTEGIAERVADFPAFLNRIREITNT